MLPGEERRAGGQMGWHLRMGVRVVPALRGRVCHAPARVGKCVCPCPRCAAGLRDRNPVCLALGHAASPPPTAQAHTDSLNTLVALHQLYQYTQKYYDEVGAVSRLPGAGTLGQPLPGLPPS